MKSPKFSKRPNLLRLPFMVREVYGHSMVPVLPPGTTVYGWKWFRSIKPGDIVIFFHDGREKVKRIDRLVDGRIFVIGDHPETSTDSRHFGWLDAGAVIAKVVWPHAPKHRAEGVEP